MTEMDKLERDGFLLVPGALDSTTVNAWREMLYRRHATGVHDIANSVGNYAYDHLLEEEPELARPLIGHGSVAPFLKETLGRQCQLRSFRAHLNRADYLQEWHLDFYQYWDQKREGRHAAEAVCMNTTFYLTDNTPETGRLRFLPEFFKNPVPEDVFKHFRYTDDRNNPFQKWCDTQAHVDLYPMAGDAVVFFSQIPHQGAKLGDDPDGLIRCNIVLHYQANPMFPGVGFVSSSVHTLETLGFEGSFPFAAP